jgi:signal peptidase II
MNAGVIYNLISVFIFLILIFLMYLIISSTFIEKLLLSLIFGGAAGNLYDRVFYFAVPDFIDFHINNFHWFTFNIADIFISIGIILFITKEIVIKK